MKEIIKNKVDILLITKTKLNSSFPNSQLMVDSFRQPNHLNRNRHGRGVMIFVRERFLGKYFRKYTFFDNELGTILKASLRKTKWLMLKTYDPPNQPVDDFLSSMGTALVQY